MYNHKLLFYRGNEPTLIPEEKITTKIMKPHKAREDSILPSW
jgi:hypothetical protein